MDNGLKELLCKGMDNILEVIKAEVRKYLLTLQVTTEPICPEVLVKTLVPGIDLPEYQSAGAAGFDIKSIISITLLPGETQVIDTGLFFAIPQGYEMQIRPRSGLAAKYQLTVLNSPGTIDSDYRGELKIILTNLGSSVYSVAFGDRIAQGVISAVIQCKFKQTSELPPTERGSGGFGSTGVK